MHLPRLSYCSRRIGLPLLLAAVFVAQLLGLVHRVVHAPHVEHAASQARDHAARDLFGAHDDDAQCRLYDQLAQGDLAIGDVLPAPGGSAPTHAVAVHPTWHLAAQAAGFQARGPPGQG